MSLRINTNLASLVAQRHLEAVTSRLTDNFRRLSTGLRIATAADDPAGLATSERLRAQIRSLDAAGRNVNDGVSMLQIAEGALNETSSILIRLRELAMVAANGTTSNEERETLNQEFQALVAELDRQARATNFSGMKMLDGSVTQTHFQVGVGTVTGVDTVQVSFTPALATSLGLVDASGATLTIGSGGDTSAALAAVDSAVNTVVGLRGRLAATQNRLNLVQSQIAVAGENLSAADSRIRDLDVAAESSALARNTVIQQAALAILAQANSQPLSALSLLR